MATPSRLPCARRKSALRRPIVIVAAMLRRKARNGGRRAAAKPLPDFAGFARRNMPPAFRRIDPRKRADKPTDRPCVRHTAHQRAGPVRTIGTDHTRR